PGTLVPDTFSPDNSFTVRSVLSALAVGLTLRLDPWDTDNRTMTGVRRLSSEKESGVVTFCILSARELSSSKEEALLSFRRETFRRGDNLETREAQGLEQLSESAGVLSGLPAVAVVEEDQCPVSLLPAVAKRLHPLAQLRVGIEVVVALLVARVPRRRPAGVE